MSTMLLSEETMIKIPEYLDGLRSDRTAVRKDRRSFALIARIFRRRAVVTVRARGARLSGAIGIAVAAILYPASASAYCSKPDAPYCATGFGAFDDRDEFDSCRREMQNYQSEAEDFISCKRREIEEAERQAGEVAEEYDEAVESFNQRARSR